MVISWGRSTGTFIDRKNERIVDVFRKATVLLDVYVPLFEFAEEFYEYF